MSKINETNYPRRTQANYADTDMLVLQAAGGNTYTTRMEDMRDDYEATLAPTINKINDALAPAENGATASQSYAIGEHFMRDGAFCTAIAAITSGGSFTLNTNYKVDDVANNLEQLNSDIASQALTFTWDENTHSAGSVVTARKAGNVVTLRFWNVSFSNVISTDMQVGHITGYTATHDHSFMFASGDQVPLMGTGYISNAGKVYVSHYQTANKLVYGTATLVL